MRYTTQHAHGYGYGYGCGRGRGQEHETKSCAGRGHVHRIVAYVHACSHVYVHIHRYPSEPTKHTYGDNAVTDPHAVIHTQHVKFDAKTRSYKVSGVHMR